MDTLPYEIVQMIASCLLPRYQCRLAMTSRFYYQYLYTDLLRWHVTKDALAVPKYESFIINDKKFSLRLRNGELTLYSDRDGFVFNLTSLRGTLVKNYYADKFSLRFSRYMLKLFRKILNRLRKYLHIDIIRLLIRFDNDFYTTMHNPMVYSTMDRYLSMDDLMNFSIVIDLWR